MTINDVAKYFRRWDGTGVLRRRKVKEVHSIGQDYFISFRVPFIS